MGKRTTYRSDSVYGNSPPIFTNWAECQAYPGVAGDIGYVSRLVGDGFFQVQYTGTLWEVCPGECIAKQQNPLTLPAAPNTSPRINTLITIPGNLIGPDSCWEIALPTSCGTNVGGDSFSLLMNSITALGPFILTSGTYSPSTLRFNRSAATIERPLLITSSTSAAAPIAVDAAGAITVQISITAATINNTERVRYLGVRRLF